MVMPRVAWASDQRSAVLNRTAIGEAAEATVPVSKTVSRGWSAVNRLLGGDEGVSHVAAQNARVSFRSLCGLRLIGFVGCVLVRLTGKTVDVRVAIFVVIDDTAGNGIAPV